MRFRRGTIDGGSDRRFGKTSSATATLDGSRLVRQLNGLVARLLLLFSSLLFSSLRSGKNLRTDSRDILQLQYLQKVFSSCKENVTSIIVLAIFLKLTEEKNRVLQQNNKLRQELELLRRGHAKSSGGLNLLYIVLVGLIGILMGYFMRKS
ncbi:hypothetical protein ACSBR2_023312 [Camellia fascicularis]